MTDWREWHEQYSDPVSSLSRRLRVVQRRLEDLLASGSIRRILSLCAGDGRDVIPVLARRPREGRPDTVLVELDPILATDAQRRAAEADVPVSVVVGDAGLAQTWTSVLTVDLLMLCGIGNIADEDIFDTVRAAPGLLSPAGVVIWTREAFNRDLRPQIRQSFEDAGFSEIAFDYEPAGYGVGVNCLTSGAPVSTLPERLFSFVRPPTPASGRVVAQPVKPFAPRCSR